MIVAFACSAELHEPALDFYKDILRQLWNKYENDLVLRVVETDPNYQGGELFDFLEAMSVPLERFATTDVPEIRIKRMLSGVVYNHETYTPPCKKGCDWHPPGWPHPLEVRPPADLSLAFCGRSTGDFATTLYKTTLKGGSTYPVWVYREKWSAKKKGREQKFAGKITLSTRHKRNRFTLGEEKIVWPVRST